MSRPAVLAASLLCALPGGWLASLAWTPSPPVRLALVLAGALVGAAVAALAVTGPPPARPDPARPPASRPRHREADRAVPRHAPTGFADPSPANRHPAGPDSTGPDSARTDGGDRAEPAALIAQCPRCGELRLDSGRHGPAYRFRCGNPGCGHAWTWHPDEPWPPVVVRRNLPAGPARPR